MRIEVVRSVLAASSGLRPPVDAAAAHAAIAVVLRERARGAEVLFIERAARAGDPWSGHMAFPGGRLERCDDSTRAAACRETFEEVGLEIARAEYLGHLGDLTGRRGAPRPMVVAAHAFHLEEDQPLRLDLAEVRSAFWFPLADLHDGARRTTHRLQELPDHEFPAIVVGEPGRHFVWGLTYRILEQLFDRAGRPLLRT